jgi:hypothetical protein
MFGATKVNKAKNDRASFRRDSREAIQSGRSRQKLIVSRVEVDIT